MRENNLPHRSRQIAALLLMLALCAPLMPVRAALYENDNAVVVTRAEVDFDTNRITITGKNFGTEAPTLKLEYQTLIVVSISPSQIVALLPAGIQPGTYLLTIRRPKKGKIDGSASLSVIDTSNNTVVANVPVGGGPRSVALNPSGTRAYIVRNGSGSAPVVTVLDTSTNTVIVANLFVGAGPWGVAVNPSGTRAYTVNLGNSVSVINTANNAVVGTISVSNPTHIAFNPSGSRAYVTRLDNSSVSVIDTANNTVVAAVGVGFRPTSVGFNASGSRAYVANDGSSTVSVIDTATNAVVANINGISRNTIVAGSTGGAGHHGMAVRR